MKMKHLFFFLISLLQLQNLTAQTKYEPWQHPVIVAYQNKLAQVVGFTHNIDADYYIPLAILKKNSNTLYYINTFGIVFDSLAIGPKLSQQLQQKNIDAFETYSKLVIVEELKEIETVKNLLREIGNKFYKFIPKATHINYSSLNKEASILEKLIQLDNYAKSSWQQYYLLNTIIEDRKDSLFLAKKRNVKYFKPAKLQLHQQNDTLKDIIYTNSNKFSTLQKAILNPYTASIAIYNQADVLVDTFTVKKEKLHEITSEKVDVFALYRNWLEYQLQTTDTWIKEITVDKNKTFTSYTAESKQAIYTNLLNNYITTNSKIIYATKPDKDLLLIDLLTYTSKVERKTFNQATGWALLTPLVDKFPTTVVTRGSKEYFLTDHRGNVMATVSDRKIQVDANNDGIIDYYVADVITATDYAPFGSALAGRTYNNGTGLGGKKYGYNGKENDKDISEGVQDYGMRIYDSRLGRFLSVDPLAPHFSYYTPYQFAGNMPIAAIDLDGLEPVISTDVQSEAPVISLKHSRSLIEPSEDGATKVVKGFFGLLGGIVGVATQVPAAAHYGDKIPKNQFAEAFPSIPNDNIVKDIVLPMVTSPLILGSELLKDPGIKNYGVRH